MTDLRIDDILDEFQRQAGGSRHTKQSDPSSELLQCMLNERMAPELLPYQHELMDRVLQELSNQQQFLLDSHEYGDSNVDSGMVSQDFKLQLMIIETDIERLSYMVRVYLRTRLLKINDFLIFYIGEAEAHPRLLSSQETDYMHKHFKILTLLYNNSFLKKMPNFLTLLDDNVGNQSMVAKPDVNVPVFIKVKTASPILIPLGNTDELELVKDGVYVVKYDLVRRYVELGDIDLM